MSDPYDESLPASEPASQTPVETTQTQKRQENTPTWFDFLAQLGLGETVARLGSSVLTFVLVLLVVWLLRLFYDTEALAASEANQASLAQPTATPPFRLSDLPEIPVLPEGIERKALIHTTIPSRPRQEVVKYTVQAGDTVFGIAEKWGLKPQTILWANYYTLRDDPHNLQPDQKLNILPVDGAYYEWQPGDGLNTVARFFGVKPEDIINYPLNGLDPATIGDYANPNIKPGTWLVVPGGSRPFISWSAPIGVTRDNPGVARQMGPGACGVVKDGAVGFGSFIWPTTRHYLSGFDYSPETNHRGIDIAGSPTEGAYAADAGVIVYAGWNDWGYGNMVVVDHGNGWQTLYAHLSTINVVCGMSVGQGAMLGLIGSTGRSSGPHLHFEMMHTQYGKVNPWSYLPPP
ncbi:MAG: peptidoglycan DD-metalloendopeptidase family protein [Anaerolineales bacterium]|nr:peptidoglycan DD-metalloendopeptidase family protein [Anaerolineales bacterium]MCX7753989.1 peptidoglycan DD-metalloendopeptidase family protein [Anaerolineales bacterium]MDW8276805.1 peptidoglycan DD-metalloendopeptidase family protein [Anaerolineales bacterium]